MTENTAFNFATVIDDAKKVVLGPAVFYRGMAKLGGYGEPLIFIIVMGLIAGIVAAIMSIFGSGLALGGGFGFMAIVTLPIVAVIGSFISGAIMFVIWKLMGSAESFHTAWRCVAYSMAIFPITMILQWIPYLGSVIGVVAVIWLMIHASVEVHKIEKNKALIVLGVIGAILVLMNLSGERAARSLESRLQQHTGQLESQLEGIEDMSPEEAGEALGKFLKGLEKGQKE